jgi:hypothetical protein
MRTLTVLARTGVTFVSALLAGALTTWAWNLAVHGAAQVGWTTATRLAVILAVINAVREAFGQRVARTCRS